MKFEFNSPRLKERRKELRKNQTEAEKILWQQLRNRRFQNLRFLRQYSVGAYILDFYCPEMRFAIELDGAQHFREHQKEYDQNRTFYLEMKKIKVIRFENYFIFHNLQEVLQKISKEIESSSSKSPLLA